MRDRHWKGKQAGVKAPASIWPTFGGIGMGSAGKPAEEFTAAPRGRDDAATFGAGSPSSRRNEVPGPLQSGVPSLFRLRE